jgi:hypothetical protein
MWWTELCPSQDSNVKAPNSNVMMVFEGGTSGGKNEARMMRLMPF